MIDDKMTAIKERIQNAPSMSDENRQATLALLEELQAELKSVDADQEKAESVASFTELGVNEGSRENPDPTLFSHAVEGMNKSVESFEESHPKLVRVINAISNTLSNSGI